MAECEFLPACSFFNDMLDNVPTAQDLIKRMYCHHNYEECARHMIGIKMGPNKIPSDLFPKDLARAAMLLSEGN